jgi:maleamate amidohydrolase
VAPDERRRAHCWDDVLGDDERLVARGYAGDRYFRGPPALLMVDLYNKAFGPTPLPLAEAVRVEPSSCGLAGWEALPSLETLLRAARGAHRTVVHTVPESGVGGAALRRLSQRGEAWGDAIVDALRPRTDEIVLPKGRASAFCGTLLDSLLRRAGVQGLVVAGESTSGCVRATVVDAFSLGFDVVVVEEATFDRSPLSHRVNLFDMHCKYATVVGVECAVALLGEGADTSLVPW